METSIVASLIVAVIVSLITTRLAFHRFRDEKGWERRAEAYDDVVAALHEMSVVLEAEIRTLSCRTNPTDEEQEKRDAKYSEEKRKVARVAALGGYILRKDARDELKEFLRPKSDPNDSWDDVLVNS